MMEYVIRGERETEEFGSALADKLEAGDVLALIGDLGTGKTTLTKSIAKGLGIGEMITSPTFTIVSEYFSGRLPLFHFGSVERMRPLRLGLRSTLIEVASAL